MSCPTCENEPCTCTRISERLAKPEVRSTYRPVPLGITKEEFGVQLYETIKLIGGIKGLHDQIAGAIHRGEGWKVQGLKERRDRLRVELATSVTKNTEAEMAQLLERYPMIASL